MRKVVFILSFLLICSAVCWKSVCSVALKSIAWAQYGMRFDCQSIRFQEKKVVLEGVVLFNTRGKTTPFVFRSDFVRVSWPLQLQLERPHISLSRQISGVGRGKPIPIEIIDGRIDWLDGAFPSCECGFIGNGANGFLQLARGNGSLKIEWNRETGSFAANWVEAPLSLLGNFAANGETTGHAEGEFDAETIRKIHIASRAERVVLNFVDWSANGSAEIDWTGFDIRYGSDLRKCSDQWRITVEGGFVCGESEIRNLRGSSSFQKDFGLKVEAAALALTQGKQLPLTMDAKASLRPDRNHWITAACKLGDMDVALAPEGILRWENLGVREARFLKELANLWSREVDCWSWLSGICRGSAACDLENFDLKLVDLEVKDLHLARKELCFGCETFRYGPLGMLDGGWIEWDGERRGDRWSGKWDPDQLQLDLVGDWDYVPSHVNIKKMDPVWNAVATAGSFFTAHAAFQLDDLNRILCSFDGNVNGFAVQGSAHCCRREASNWGFSISIPQFEGDISSLPWMSGFVSGGKGNLSSVDSGVEIEGNWNGTLVVDQWKFDGRFQNGQLTLAPLVTLNNVAVTIHANQDLWDFGRIEGISRFILADRAVDIPFEAPRIAVQNGLAQFDIRCRRSSWDFLRLVGEKQGRSLQFDSERCRLLGAPLQMEGWEWDENGFAGGSFTATVSLTLLRSLAGTLPWIGQIPVDGIVEASGKFEKGAYPQLILKGVNTVWKENPLPLRIEIEDGKAKATIGILAAEGRTVIDEGWLRIKEGTGSLSGMTFDFDGKLNTSLQGEFTLRRCEAQVSRISELFSWAGIPLYGIEGKIDGKGYLALNLNEVEADLDFTADGLSLQGYTFTNRGPLHLYLSSSQGAAIKGLDFSIAKDGDELMGKIDLCQIDAKKRRWVMKKSHLHLPADFLSKLPLGNGQLFDPGQGVDLFGDVDCSFDFSDFSCEMQEAIFPVGAALRHLEEIHFFYDDHEWMGNFTLSHQGQKARISFEIEKEESYSGKCLFEDFSDEAPLSIHWSYSNEGLSLHAVDGCFGGVDASFHCQDFDEASRLIGTARVDFAKLSLWIPAEIAEVFSELKMGKGYELRGNLSVGRKEWSDIRFSGIFSGKQIELFGFELRTLLGQVDLSAQAVRIYDLKISDSAGILKVDEIKIEGKGSDPWTLSIPKLIIEELRPSLLHAPGEAVGELSPLLVRKLTMTDFKGLLDEGKTWTAKGDLSFINSFKRGDAILDVPPNIFGRIVGLDLSLLIPIVGDLTFSLKDGYFTLGELKDTFSEGRRSQFFLVPSDTSPRMDLDGNLQILIKMKQYVLFKFTDAFMISIEGKLNDPKVSLQKKRRFLSLPL